ncbi:putative ribonuclease H-like domain-containing protein [Tanacetum coccineum]
MVQMTISLTNMNANKLLMLVQGFKEFSSDEQIMTSNHNSSELGIHDHNNKQSSSKLVPKVVPLADKTATSRQELELLFHHHIKMLRSYALSWKPCQGDSLNLPDHRHTISIEIKNHESSRIKDKDFHTNSDIKDNSSEIKLQGRLLASFQDDAKYEHVGQDTRSQGRRLGHINFKTMNKLVKGNLVRGLPSKLFENDQTCVACQKGKQHRASCKSKTVSSISQPLHMLHMDLFGLTFVKSLMKKMYCLVVTDDYSRFSWVFFLATKDETSGILKSFITGVENLIDQRVKVIRCDNRTEFKNKEMNQFCERKGIKREFSIARTPQQNGVAERKNRTLIEAARTMLADSKLPTTFWAEAVNTACYVQNRVLVTKPHNKTPYELFLGRKPALGFMRPFGCPVTILNTIDHLGKLMPDIAGNQSNDNAGTKSCDDAGKARMETVPGKDYILLPLWLADPTTFTEELGKEGGDSSKDSECSDQEKEDIVNSTNNDNAASTNEVNVVGRKSSIELPDDLNMPELEDIIKEEVYVCQPPGFEDPDFLDIIYKVEKALYGLHQAPRAWTASKAEGRWNFYLLRQVSMIDILKKFCFTNVKTAITPMETQKALLKDKDGEEVDVHLYRSMIGSFMYLTSSRHDIILDRSPQQEMSITWVLKIDFQYSSQKAESGANSHNERMIFNAGDSKLMLLGINLLLLGKVNAARHKLTTAVETVKNTAEHKLTTLWQDDEEGMDCLPNATIFEELTRMGYEKLSQKLTFYKAFFSPQWKFFIHTVLQCLSAKTTAWNEFSSTIASAIICLATNQKFNFSKYIFENIVKNLENVSSKFLMYPRFVQVFLNQQLDGRITHKRIYVTPSHTKKEEDIANMRRPKKKDTQVSQPSDPTNVADEAVNEEPSMQLKELMDFCTNCNKECLTWRTQRLLKLRRLQEDVSKQGRKIDDIDADAKITLVDETQGRYRDEDMFGVHDLDGDEVVVGSKVTNKASEKRNIVEEAVAVTTSLKDKGKAKMIEPEKPLKKKDQIKFDEEEALMLQAEFDEEDRPAREKAQQELTIEDKSTLFQQLLEIRRKFFATKRAEEERNRPPTRAQQRSIMCTYLKNMAGWKPKDLKNKSFANIQELFDKAMKRVNTFVDMDTELVEGSEVRAEGSFDTYTPHQGRFQDMYIFKLVEKRYPLTPATITDMLNRKLQADHLNEMCYQLLILITKQLKNQ